MAKVLILSLAFFLAGCQTNQTAHPTDLMMSQADLVRQEMELTPHCDLHAEVERLLEHKYKEQPLLAGGYLDGSIMQLYAGPNGAWSLSREIGPITCVLATGYGLQIIDPPTKPVMSKKEI